MGVNKLTPSDDERDAREDAVTETKPHRVTLVRGSVDPLVDFVFVLGKETVRVVTRRPWRGREEKEVPVEEARGIWRKLRDDGYEEW